MQRRGETAAEDVQDFLQWRVLALQLKEKPPPFFGKVSTRHCPIVVFTPGLDFRAFAAPHLSSAAASASPRLPPPPSAGRAVGIRKAHVKFYGLTRLRAGSGQGASCAF